MKTAPSALLKRAGGAVFVGKLPPGQSREKLFPDNGKNGKRKKSESPLIYGIILTAGSFWDILNKA